MEHVKWAEHVISFKWAKSTNMYCIVATSKLFKTSNHISNLAYLTKLFKDKKVFAGKANPTQGRSHFNTH